MNIKILVYNIELQQYKTEWTLDLVTVPRVGDKIEYKPNQDEPAYVYNVDAVHFGDHKRVDLRVHVVSDVVDYNSIRSSTQNFQ